MSTHRLPTNIKAINYDLHLAPNLETFRFDGYEKITFNVQTDTNTIVLNVKDLTIRSAYLSFGNGVEYIQATDMKVNTDREELTMTFPDHLLTAGLTAYLNLDFSGVINDKMAGFYRSKRIKDGEETYCAVTQFESTDARRAFPCADEPSLKATFDVTIAVPKGRNLTALSNMPVKEIREGYVMNSYVFDKTPIMSTYLLAFFVGKVNYIESVAKMPHTGNEVAVRVYVPPGEEETGRFSLDLAVKTLEFFSNYFAIDYPLPKMDMVGLPDFAAGAMENWGLVTYRSNLLYVVDGVTSTSTKEYIATVVCHELAHQWFGNLVTIEWWTDLWLNEGFATWVGNMATAHFFPEWNVWDTFVGSEFNRALELDQLDSSHPIQVTVNKASEVDEIFDAISYSKGASIIRQLVNFMGYDDFRNGMRDYLQTFKYSNAKTEDLWQKLSDASGKNIGDMMNTWTKITGYPLIKVSRTGNTLTFEQERYNVSADTVWAVPITILQGRNENNSNPYDSVTTYMLTDKVGTFDCSGDWVKLNAECVGLFRTMYTNTMLNDLKPLVSGKVLRPSDRAELVSNLFSLAKTGNSSITTALTFLDAYSSETSLAVMEEIAININQVRSMWGDGNEILRSKINRYIAMLFKYTYDRLGWTKKDSDTHSDSILRMIVIKLLGNTQYDPVLNTGCELFTSITSGDTSVVSPDLVRSVLSMCVKNGGRSEYNAVKKLYESTESSELQGHCLIAMGYVSKDLVVECLDYVFNSGHVRSQDMSKTMSTIVGDGKGSIVWQYVVDNWSSIVTRFKSGNFLFGRIVSAPLRSMRSMEYLNNASNYLDTKETDVKDIKMTLDQAKEAAKTKITWIDRDMDSVVKFFEVL